MRSAHGCGVEGLCDGEPLVHWGEHGGVGLADELPGDGDFDGLKQWRC